MAFQKGDRVGDYEIVGDLGAGGMGKVYRVRNVISEREEAMKVLLPNLTTEPELADRFMREIRVQARLQHPNIATLNTAFRYENQLVMVMELVDGVTLQDRMHQGPLTISEALDYTSQVLRALSYAHKQGVIHRDIKPANMILMPGGTVKLLDFGIAKVVADRKLTMTGMTVGSLHYMSPEQIQGKEPDPRSDLYSVGVSLYQFVTGQRPIDADSDFALMTAQMQATPRPPIEVDPKISPELNDIVMVALKKQPEERFQSADAFLNAIQSVQQPGRPVPATAIPAPVKPPQAEAPRGSHRALYMAVGAIAAIVVLALAAMQAPKFFGTHASEQTQPKMVQNPAPDAQPTPAPAPTQPMAQTPVEPQAQAPVESPAQQPGRIVTRQSAPVNPPRQTPSVVTAPAEAPGGQAPAGQAPRVQTTPVPVQAGAPAVAAPPQAASNAEIEKVQESMTLLGARMNAVNQSVDQLARAQNASGLAPNGDIISAQHLMQSFYSQAEAALRAGDATAAARNLSRAEKNLEKLEKLFNR